MFIKKISILAYSTLIFSSPFVLANINNESGDNGSVFEERVNEIRSDLLRWIKNEGAKGLRYPKNISYNTYVTDMSIILQKEQVSIIFTEDKVIYDNSEKTCKGIIDELSSEMHIICNTSRFANTTKADQYKLVHHEYAGLARIEKNEGAASDYNLSSQITDFITSENILQLSIQKNQRKSCNLYINEEDKLFLGFHNIIKSLKNKKYIISSRNEAQYSIESLFFNCEAAAIKSINMIELEPSVYNCNHLSAELILNNDLSGEELSFIGYSSFDGLRPTQAKAVKNLLKNIPECK